MSDEQAEQNPQIVNIPLAIAAQTINYNLPELGGSPLKLDGPTIAGIYSGKIREWDAAPIKALNPGVTLPHHEIIPIRRADASGDTFVFTQFLDFSTPSWDDKVGYGTSVTWPSVPGEMTAVGNAGMLKAVAGTPYSIGYIGISYKDEVAKARPGHGDDQEPEWKIPVADTGYDKRRGRRARQSHASGRATESGVCSRRRFLSA